jgi:hypothetical protein
MTMNTKIRKSVFETNSSSCHSITIERGVDIFSAGFSFELNIYNYDFGWSKERFYSAYEKAAYLMIYIRDWVLQITGRKTVDDDQVAKLFTDILYEVIEQVTGNSYVLINGVDFKTFIHNFETMAKSHPELLDGYIDHQSVENNNYHYLFKDKELLRDFLFNEKSYIQTDNDNH